MKNKKYVFELVIRESENLEKICSSITTCNYDIEELKERKVDHEILFCKDILVDSLPKTNLRQIINENKNLTQQDSPYPTFASSWDDKSYDEILKENKLKFSHIIGSCDVETCNEIYRKNIKDFAFYHKPTKLWVYFLPNYEQRRVISLGLKNDASTFREHRKEYFTELLKSCSFNGVKNYGRDNFLEFECKEIKSNSHEK